MARTTSSLTCLLALGLVAGHFILSPIDSDAGVTKVEDRVRAGQMTLNRHPDMPARLFSRLNDADIPALVTSSDTLIRVGHAPQATETCAEAWQRDVSHQSWRCIDGVWHQIEFEQWACKQPQQVVDHTHQQRTEEPCSTS